MQSTQAPDEATLVERSRELLRRMTPDLTPDRELRGARFDAGLAFVHFREGDGGSGASSDAQSAVDAVFAEAGCPDWRDANVIGLGMAAPTLHEHGTAEQRRLLRPLFTGEDIWCQLFSEPGAGSDLAGLATSARRDGDEWIVNGQKVWTSLGHVARYGLLLARHDPTQTKHAGLTYFIVDMTAPGVEVRPLRQLTGDAEFNEVFLTDVRIPDSMRLGDVGAGWRVAMTTLSNERMALGASVLERGEGPIAQAVELWHQAVAEHRAEPELLDRLIRLWCRAEATRLMNARAVRSGTVGSTGSLSKLRMAELNQGIYDLCLDLMGAAGTLYDTYDESRPTHAGVHGHPDPRRGFLRTLANSIEGGTSEIQRTIIGERLLGLPAEPRIDKDVPWNARSRQ